MKLIHCADLHLDSKMETGLSREQARERRSEILRTFTRMVDYAENTGAVGIIIAGDLFDTRNVSATARNVVLGQIEGHPDLLFFYLRGNHDEDNFLSKLEKIPENLLLFGEEWTSYDLNSVTVSGIEITDEKKSSMYNSLVLPYEKYNIVVLHGQVSGYDSRDRAEIISTSDLGGKNIDYVALGHIHSMQTGKLDARGMYAYPGCLEGRGFDECGDKGFIELDIDEEKRTAVYRFVSIAERSHCELPVDISGMTNTNEAAKKIEAAINECQIPAKSLVRIILKGVLDVECELNTDYLAELFSEYFYLLKVRDDTKILIDYRSYEKDESLKGEFVRLVQASDLSEEEKSEVIRCGIMALSGEEY